MLIQTLLEGSERLFHTTQVNAIGSILSAGGLLTSQLMSSELEVRIVRKAGGREKLYYLSFSRNLANDYIHANIDYDKLVTFEFDSRSIAKYGKVVPVNFFGLNTTRGEMEDRLITDHNIIPLTAVKHIRCVVGSDNESVHNKLSNLGIPISFYDSVQDLMTNKRPKTFKQCYGGGTGKSELDGLRSKTKKETIATMLIIAKIFHEYLEYDGDPRDTSDPFFEKLFEHYHFEDFKKYTNYVVNNTLWMFRIADPELGHSIMQLLRKRGMDNAWDIIRRFYLVWESISGGKKDENY